MTFSFQIFTHHNQEEFEWFLNFVIFLFRQGRKMVAAGYALYGSATMMVISINKVQKY